MKVRITSDTNVPQKDRDGLALYRLTNGALLAHPNVVARIAPFFIRAGVKLEEVLPGHAVLTEQSKGAFLECM